MKMKNISGGSDGDADTDVGSGGAGGRRGMTNTCEPGDGKADYDHHADSIGKC